MRCRLDRGSANCAAALTLPLPLFKNNLFGGSGSVINKIVLNSRVTIRAKKQDTSEIQVAGTIRHTLQDVAVGRSQL